MTRYEIYRCDRCGKEMKMEMGMGTTPQCIKDIKENISYDLCEDCYCTFDYFLTYAGDFDELAEKLCNKEIELKEKTEDQFNTKS